MSDLNSDRASFYRKQSFWLDSLHEPLEPRDPLQGQQRADVAIIGAGYTGLWTAYYLKQHAPHLDIAIVEAEIAGFGASGRNGGWCSAYLANLWSLMQDPKTRSAAIDLQRQMFATVDEVGRVSCKENIDCDFSKSGHIAYATNPTQLQRDREELEFVHSIGFGDEDYRWLEPGDILERLKVANPLGGFFVPHVAAIQPAKLARGLARALEVKGVRIYEQSPATSLSEKSITTKEGELTADVTLMATEGYTRSIPEARKKLVAVHSNMIATEPLTADEIEATGLNRRYCWNNGKHLVTYGQLTADGRIAFGSRGKYLYDGAIQGLFEETDPVFDIVRDELAQIFPPLKDKKVTHRWGGAMGVSRTLSPAVCFDRHTGIGWAGGYFGDGVGASNLAGRTLADLVLDRDTQRSQSLWVNPARNDGLRDNPWEPEPLRWIAFRSRTRWMGWTDQAEARNSSLAGGLNQVLEKVFP